LSPCPGRCVSPLASIFTCDKILSSKKFYCRNSGLDCCVDKDVSVSVSGGGGGRGACIEEGFKSNCGQFYATDFCPSGNVCCHSDKVSPQQQGQDEGSEEVGEEEEDEEGVNVRPKNETMMGTNDMKKKSPCRGTCRAMIFGLFLCKKSFCIMETNFTCFCLS